MIGLDLLTGSNRTAIIVLSSVLAALILAAVCGYWGWTRGSASARNELKAEYATNLADAYREAAIKQQAETTRANGLAAELITTKRTLESERTQLRGRIEYVTRDVPADCVLPADAVRLWNEARRLSAPGVPQAGAPGGADGQTATAPVADTGIQQDASIADGIANWVDYVKWCEGVVGQRDTLQELVRGWAQ